MKTRGLLFTLLFTILLSACNLPVRSEAFNGANTWIDAPLDGSQIPLAPYEIVMHATGAENITGFEVKVNGMVETTVEAVKTPAGVMLYMGKYWWLPPDNGDYTIEVRARNASGLYSMVADAAVTVGEQYALLPYTPFDPNGEIDDTPAEVSCAHRAEWLNQGQVYPVYGGEVFTVTWQLKNVGNCPWDESFKIIRVDDPSVATDFVEKEWPLNARVEPGQTVDVKIQVTAPASIGYRRANWMLSDGQTIFGTGENANVAFWFDYEVQARAGDNEPPVFTTYTVSPVAPIEGQELSVTIGARDNVKVTQIRIVFRPPGSDEIREQFCSDQSVCTFALGSWPAGALVLDAYASDQTGNVAQLGAQTIVIQTKSNPTNPTAVPTPIPTPVPTSTPAKDTTPPKIVDLDVSPESPNEGDLLTITVSATDDTKVASIEIILTPQGGGNPIRQVCQNVNTCVLQGRFAHGTLVLNVNVKDPSGNTGSIFPFTITVKEVIH